MEQVPQTPQNTQTPQSTQSQGQQGSNPRTTRYTDGVAQYTFNGKNYNTKEEAVAARDTYKAAVNADWVSVGKDRAKYDALIESGRGLSQMSDDELGFIRDRYAKSDLSKRKEYTKSGTDAYLFSMGLPSAKEINSYRQKYIDYMGNGGIEQHPELADKDGNLTDASKWIQKQWEKDNAEGLGGETVTSGGKDIKYEDTYLDDQLKSIGLPPSARLNEYFLKYKDDKAIDDLVDEFYSDVYKNGQGANAEDAFRETLGKPKYSKLAEYWAEPAKIPNGDQYTDTAKYDKDYKTALETNAKREEMDHRVSYDDYSNYAARRSAEERRTAQEKKYKEINEKAYQWYTKPATTPQEKKERENDMRNYLNVYGGGDNYTPYIDEETKEVVDPVRIATESNSTFRLLDLGMSPKMAGEIYDGSGTLDVFGLAAAVDWNNSRNASPAEKAEVAMILSGASTDSTTYDMDKEVITETYRVTDSKSYDKRKSFDANDYRNQITGGTSAVEKVTFAGAVYALVNGQKHGMPDYSDQTDYGIFQTFTKTDSSGKSIAEFMTDDEKGTFNYLFHYDKKRAMKYAEDLSDMLARRRQVYTSGTYDEKARSGVIPETDAAQYGADNYINRTRRKLETIPESRSDYWQREAWEAYGGYSDYALQLVIDDAKSGDASEIFAQAEAAEARGEYFNLDDAVAEKDKNAAYAQYILDLRKKAQEVGAVEASMLKYKASEGEEATKSIKAEDCVGSKYGLIVNGLEKYASMKAFSTFADQLRDNETIVMHDVLVNMTKEEKNQFNWLLKNKGAKEADAYIDLIYSTLDERGKERSAAVYTDFAKEHPGAASAASLVAFPVSGLASLSGSFINAVTGTKTTKQQATMWDPSGIMTEAVSDVIASKVGKGFWGDAAVFGYQTTMSMAQSGIAAAISAAVPGLGGFLLASSAFASTLRDGLDRGLDPDRATATAFLAGVAEMFFEEVSLEKFITGIKGAKGWRTVLANIAKQSFTEGSEEFFTEVANIISDYLINQDMSELQQKYDDYIDRGYTPEEANSLIAKDVGTQLGMATLGGAVSGGIMGGLGNIGAFGFNAALGRLEEKAGIVRNEGTNFKEVKAALAPQNFGVKNPATTEQVRAIGASEKFLTRTFGKNIADQVWGQAAVNNISSERIDTFKNAITQDTNTNSYLWGITHDGQNNISLSDDELTSLAACMAALTDEGEANPEAAYIALMAASQSETALKANNDIKNIKSVEELNGFREAIQDARDGIEGQMETLRDLQSQVAEESNDAMARENESLQRAIAAFEDGDIKGVITALESKSAKSTETTSKNRKANEVWKAIDKARRQIAKNYKEISRQQGYVDKHFSSLYNYLAEVAPQSMYGANAAAFVAQNLKNETERLRSEISDVLTNENLSEKARDARLKNLVRMLQNAASSAQVAGSDEVMANPQAFTNAINAAKNGNAAAHQALVRNKAGVKFNNNASSSASNASDTQSSKGSNKTENTASEDVKQETTQDTQEDKPVTQTTPTKEKYEYKVDDRTQKAWVKLLKKRFGIDLIWVDSDTVLPDGTKLGNHNGCYIDTESESKKIFMNRTITSGIKASTNEVIAREYITHEMTHYIENTSNYVDLKRSALSYYRKLKGDDWVKNALKGIAQKRIEEGLTPSARSVSGEFVARFVQDVLFRENNKQSKALVWLTRQNKGVVGDMLTYIQYLIARAELRKSPDNELKIMLLDAEMHFLTALKERQVLDSKTSAAEAKPVQTEETQPKQEEATQKQPAQEETVAKQPVEEAQPVQEETPAEEPVQEEPVSERQVAEEPVAEEVTEEVAEEPAAEETVVEEKTAEEKTAPEEQPVEETQPVQEEPVAEQQTAEEPVAEEVTEEVVEEPAAEEPVVEETVTEEQPVQQEPVAEEQPVQEEATPVEQPVEKLAEPVQEKAPAEQPVQETASQQEETTPVQEETQAQPVSEETPKEKPVESRRGKGFKSQEEYNNATLKEAQEAYASDAPTEPLYGVISKRTFCEADSGMTQKSVYASKGSLRGITDIKAKEKTAQNVLSSNYSNMQYGNRYVGFYDDGAYVFGRDEYQGGSRGSSASQINIINAREAKTGNSFVDNIINYGYTPVKDVQNKKAIGNYSNEGFNDSNAFDKEKNTLGSDIVFSEEQQQTLKEACNILSNGGNVIVALPNNRDFKATEAQSLQTLREIFSAIPNGKRANISFAAQWSKADIKNHLEIYGFTPNLIVTTADNVDADFVKRYAGYTTLNITGNIQTQADVNAQAQQEQAEQPAPVQEATQTAQQSESTVEKAQPKQKRSTSKSEFKPKQALTEVNRMLKTIAASHPSLGGGAIQLNDDQLEGGGYLVTDAYQAYVFKEAFDGLPVSHFANPETVQEYKQRMGDAIGLARREYENGNATPLGINVTKETLEDYAKSLGWATPRSSRYGALPIELQNGMGVNTQYLYQALSIFPDAQFYLANTGISGNLPVIYVTSQYGDGLISPMRLDKKGYKDVGTMIREQYGKSNDSVSDIKKIAKREETSVQKKEKNFAAKATELVTNTPITARATKGRVTYAFHGMNTEGQANARSLKNIKESLTPSQLAKVTFWEKIAEAMDVDLVIHDSFSDIDGKIRIGGWFARSSDLKVHVTLDATAMSTVAHELTHFMEYYAPGEYSELRQALKNEIGKKAFDDLVKNRAKAYRLNMDVSSEHKIADGEAVANLCESMLNDPERIKRFATTAPNAAQTLLDRLKKWISAIKSAIKSLSEFDLKKSDSPGDLIESQETVNKWISGLQVAINKYNETVKQNAYEINQMAGVSENKQREFVSEINNAQTEQEEDNIINQFAVDITKADTPGYISDLKTLIDLGTMQQSEVTELENTMNEAISMVSLHRDILDFGGVYRTPEEIAAAKTNRAYKPYKENADPHYKLALDFSTLCRKRVLLQSIQERLQAKLSRALTQEETVAIRLELQKLQKEGYQIEVACALCYVEAARLKSPKVINDFLTNTETEMRKFFAKKNKDAKAFVAEKQREWKVANGYNENATKKPGKKSYDADGNIIPGMVMSPSDIKRFNEYSSQVRSEYQGTDGEKDIIKEAVRMTKEEPEQFLSAANLAKMKKEKPEIFQAFTDKVRAATRSKAQETDTFYARGDIDMVSDSVIEYANAESGFRHQSWSDFVPMHLLDTIASIIEMSTRKYTDRNGVEHTGAKMHAYTKVPDMVRFLGKTGMMLNMSLIPKGATGLKENGDLDFDSVEGMDYDTMLALRDMFPETAGNIAIGISDEQIRKMLDSNEIDYVIPYHASGLNQTMRGYLDIQSWSEFTTSQNEKSKVKRNQKKPPALAEWFKEDEARNATDGYEYMRRASEEYIRLCNERKYVPKFAQYLTENADGTYSLNDEYKNYWKLLIDRKMVNHKTGKVIIQSAVKPIFDRATALGILQEKIDRDTNPDILGDAQAREEVVKRFSDWRADRNNADAAAIKEAKSVRNRAKTATPIASIAKSADMIAKEVLDNEDVDDRRYSDDMSLDEYAEAGSELRTSVSIRDGVNKATGEPVNFIDLILDGQKKGETRNSKGLPVNKWVGIHKNGQVLGRVIFGEPIPITKNSPEYKDAYIEGTDFDIEDGQEKYYYPILDVEDFRDNPIPTAKGHNSPRYAKYNPSSSNTYYSDNMTLEDYAEQYGQKQQNPYGAANNIVTPERTSDTNRVSDSVQTLKQVRSLSQNTRDLIDSGVLEEGLGTYDPITLNSMRKQGMDYIAEHGGLSQAMRDLTSEMPNVKARDLTRIIAAANQVFYEIGSEGITSQEYADFVSEYVMMRSAWGRMGRAMQLVNDSPLGRRTYWEKVIKKINSQNKESVESGVNRLFYRKGYQKIEVPEIYFQELQEAQTQEEIDAAEYEITNWIGGNSPLTVGEALRNWRYLAMLANPVTHFRNMLGNLTMQAGRVAKDAIAAGIENIAVRRGTMTQNERTHAIRPNLSQEGKARVEELYQQHKQAIQSGGRDGFSNTLREAKRKSPFLLVDLLMQFNSQKLEDEDELFLHMTFKSAAAQIIAARGYDATKLTQEQTNEVVAYATQQAQEATYRDASKVADTLNQIAKSGWLAQLIVEGAVPFKKTPINIAKRGVLEYSPIGLARGIIDLGRNAMSSRRGNGYVISASKVADELGRGLTGSALALLGFFLSKAGILKISAGDDDRDSTFERDVGHQNYSIEIGNVSFKIDSLAPLTMPLFVGAALREEFGDGISLADFADTVAAIANPLMDMSFMSAINDALDTYDDNGMQGVLTNLAWSYASQYVPTFGGKLNNAFTPTRRTAKSAGNARNANADYRLRSMGMKVPGLSQAWLEPYVKTTGEYDVKDSGTEWVLSFMDNFLLPVNVQVIDTNPINEELARVVRVTGSTEFIPKNPTKQLTINGETRKLSAKEYTEYSKDHNESVYGALADTIRSNEYAVASEEDRAAMLEKAYSSAHRAAMKKWQGIYGSQE